MQKIALPFVACLLALAAVGAQAQTLWKWRDASGQLHISDTAPPPGTPAKDVVSRPLGSVAPAPAAAGSTPAKVADSAASSAEGALEKKKKAADQERADKDKADRAAVDAKNAAIRQENCSRAQAAVAAVQSGQRIAKYAANGEREILDDAGRADELKRAQDLAASNCGAAPAGK